MKEQNPKMGIRKSYKFLLYNSCVMTVVGSSPSSTLDMGFNKRPSRLTNLINGKIMLQYYMNTIHQASNQLLFSFERTGHRLGCRTM